jgi:hypothetical protein
MRRALAIPALPWLALVAMLFTALPLKAQDCAAPVCLVARDSLSLSHIITFDDVASSLGLGRPIDTLLTRPGARFGERFAGQTLLAEGNYDRISGTALAPLTAVPGLPGATLGAMRLPGTTVLYGHGPRGFPMIEAVGEGAIAIEFDNEQSALAFDLRGGEAGSAWVIFLRRDGSEISRIRLAPLSEASYGFLRNAHLPDIAGLLILNDDPQGVAIDNLAFDDEQLTG